MCDTLVQMRLINHQKTNDLVLLLIESHIYRPSVNVAYGLVCFNSNLILEIKVEKVQTAYIRHMQIE